MATMNVSGKTIQIEHIQGIASGYSKKTKTHVSGGGGRSVNGTGYTESVKTHHTEHVDFWVRAPDGREKHFETSNGFIPIRDGQEILVCYSVINGRENVVMANNLTSGDYYRENTRGPLLGGILLTAVFSVGMFFWILVASNGSAFSLLAFLGVLAVGGCATFINNKKHKELRAAEDDYIQKLS